MKNKRVGLDQNTRHYIKRMQMIQFAVFGVLCILFMLFAQNVVTKNKESLSQVAIAEVQESMKEAVNNIAIHIDSVRKRMASEAGAYIEDIENRLRKENITQANDILFESAVC